MSRTTRHPDLQASFCMCVDCEMSTPGYDAKEGTGKSFDSHGIIGTDDGIKLAVLTMQDSKGSFVKGSSDKARKRERAGVPDVFAAVIWLYLYGAAVMVDLEV